ncbi:hypothetical protein ASD65_14605 [Microbacterium sp. Root61]|uniref:DUF1801 domain-containing protein n=1 Tax=Microbacterium sp. Root61 TaxID=1736570 RepID=UPI0006F98064|nr:DUF1801 domain-containing protein [Microbacterium sp. Root61]KRA25511.1 hypothetical protein ASD65_14605 [Microbacterium sp. Root61]
MEPTSLDVVEFVAHVQPERRRRDAEVLLPLFQRATGEQPVLWGSIIGFGEYHYKYPSGHEGDTAAAGFAPRKAATSIYLVDGVGAHEDRLARLGPHTTGVGCLYIKDAAKIDLDVLEEIVRTSYRTVTSGTFGQRARDGGAS